MADTQARKYQITINNPKEKNLNHEILKQKLSEIKSCQYWCMADELGLETQTLHTHIFIVLKSPVRFTRLKKLFPDAHIETAHGSAQENKDYITKTGKWNSTDKSETSIEGTFEEDGEFPEDLGQGYRSDIAALYSMIFDGMSNAEIMARNPAFSIHISRMDKIRQDILEERYRTTFRQLNVTYIFGPTETGKTRGIMDEHGYGNVYRTTDYSHPFDRYASEPVLALDEFRSSLPIGDMLNYLDGYPMSLPARYANRVACYETVYIVSNIDLKDQYPNVQVDEPATWRAFLRRIHKVVEYRKTGPPIDHGNATDYIFPPPPPVPDWVREAEQAEQEELPL
jgi:hypothetical protein